MILPPARCSPRERRGRLRCERVGAPRRTRVRRRRVDDRAETRRPGHVPGPSDMDARGALYSTGPSGWSSPHRVLSEFRRPRFRTPARQPVPGAGDGSQSSLRPASRASSLVHSCAVPSSAQPCHPCWQSPAACFYPSRRIRSSFATVFLLLSRFLRPRRALTRVRQHLCNHGATNALIWLEIAAWPERVSGYRWAAEMPLAGGFWGFDEVKGPI